VGIFDHEKKAVAAVAKADKLDAYLKKCIPGWLEEYGDSLVTDSDELSCRPAVSWRIVRYFKRGPESCRSDRREGVRRFNIAQGRHAASVQTG
jgi:hypothetical protein